MRLLIATIKKEFLQLIRNRVLLFLVLVCPIVVLGIIPLSFDGEYRLRAGICDINNQMQSDTVAERVASSFMFDRTIFYDNIESAEDAMEMGELDMIFVSSDEGYNLILDGTFPRRAMTSLYAMSYEMMQDKSPGVVYQTLFNSGRMYKHYYLISLVVLVITILGAALLTLNIVNERESGVEEQFKATLMERKIYLLGKFVFFTIFCLAEIIICYLFCFFVYDLPLKGKTVPLFLVSILFVFDLLAMAMFIASFSKTQLRAVYILTITLVLLIMLSTMFSHLSSMPAWAAATRFINPLWYGVESSRKVILMGATLYEIQGLITGMILVSFILLLSQITIYRLER